jgi:CO/xanthine dehydrogenase FAD-binding subunit
MFISEYHRPATVEEALSLLSRTGLTSKPLGGGTVLNGLPDEVPDAVVDLQAIGLDGVDANDESVTLGSMTTLHQINQSGAVPETLRTLARRELPSTLRNVATIGGTIATRSSESGLLAGLLAFDATSTIVTGGGSQQTTIEALLADPAMLNGSIITSVEIPTGGESDFEGTARTPADTPIVLVVGHVDVHGSSRFAATGLTDTPIIITRAELADLSISADFRGSSDYRRHLAGVLGDRVADRLGIGDES